MCTISSKLKLCTCNAPGKELKHYWVLHRFVKGKNMLTIGEVMLPARIEKETDLFNSALLSKLLNSGNVFDEPLYPVNKDRLLLSFQMPGGSKLTYGFQYKKQAWVEIGYDPFKWERTYDEIKYGKIKHAFSKQPGRDLSH